MGSRRLGLTDKDLLPATAGRPAALHRRTSVRPSKSTQYQKAPPMRVRARGDIQSVHLQLLLITFQSLIVLGGIVGTIVNESNCK